MPYVQRDKDGNIIGTFANAQEGYAEEWVDGDCEPVAQPPTRQEVHARRLRAYADPVKGSDRYMTEAMAERILGNEDLAKAAEQKCIARREEIAELNPWPAE